MPSARRRPPSTPIAPRAIPRRHEPRARTPLNAIGGYAELMEMEIHGPVNYEQRDALDRIQRSQRHLLGLINQVLNYARIETGSLRYHISEFSFDDLLRTVEALASPQFATRDSPTAVPEQSADHGSADREKVQRSCSISSTMRPSSRRPAVESRSNAMRQAAKCSCASPIRDWHLTGEARRHLRAVRAGGHELHAHQGRRRAWSRHQQGFSVWHGRGSHRREPDRHPERFAALVDNIEQVVPGRENVLDVRDRVVEREQHRLLLAVEQQPWSTTGLASNAPADRAQSAPRTGRSSRGRRLDGSEIYNKFIEAAGARTR